MTVISAVQMQVRRRIRKVVRVMVVSGEDSFHGMGRFDPSDFFVEACQGQQQEEGSLSPVCGDLCEPNTEPGKWQAGEIRAMS